MAQGSSNPTTNLNKIAGNSISTDLGNSDSGTQRVVIASNQSTIPVSDNGGSLTVDGAVTVSGTVTADTGLLQPLTDTQLRASAVPVSNSGAFAVQAAQSGTWNITTVSTITSLSQFAGQAINLGAGNTATGTLRVVQSAASTATQTNPNLSTTSATLLAANAARRSATVFNNSSLTIFIRFSTLAASATTFTVKLLPQDYYEVPGGYSGAITAVTESGSTNAVQVTQIT